MALRTGPGLLVLGAAQLGQQYGNGADRTPPDPAAAADLLAAATRIGIAEIDTARAYGNSEQAIGEALATLAPDQASTIRLVTKVRPLDEFAGGRGGPAAVVAAVNASLRESLKALGTARVDTVLLHRARDLTAGQGAAVDAMESAVSAGTAGRWGVSISTPDELVSVCAVPGISYIQLPFNLLDRRWLADPVQLAVQQRSDIRIVARSVLLQGLLSSTDPNRWPPIPQLDVPDIQRTLAALVAEFGRRDALDLAVGYALAQPWIDAVVLGVRRREQLPALLQSVEAPALTVQELEQVRRSVRPVPEDLLDPSRWASYRSNS